MIAALSSRTTTEMVHSAGNGLPLPPLVTLRIGIFLAVFALRVAARHGDSCPVEATVDLSNATVNASGFLAESGYFFPRDLATLRDGARRGCICDLKPCLPLCPPFGKPNTGRWNITEDYVHYSAIPSIYSTNLTHGREVELVDPEKRFHVLIREPCSERGGYLLEPEFRKEDQFHVLENGSLYLPFVEDLKELQLLDYDKYCLLRRGNDSGYFPKLCFPVDDGTYGQTDILAMAIYFSGLLVLPFLIATFVVYSILPEFKNIHGSTLKCYLCCLIVTHLAFAVGPKPPPDFSAETFCFALGFVIYFSFLASFLWLNVMCFDMWWRLGGFGSLRSSGVHHDRKKLFWYSIYAWGITAVLTAICIGMEFSLGVPKSLVRPGFRSSVCRLNTEIRTASYFFGPVSVTVVCNVCLFISISIIMIRQKQKSDRDFNGNNSKRHDRNRQWLRLCAKLFVVMGICWSTDIIFWLWNGPKYLWFFTAMVEHLQSVLICVIFVCKKSIWRSLKERWNKKARGTAH